MAWPTAGGSITLGFAVRTDGLYVSQDGKTLAHRVFETPLAGLPAWGQLVPRTCAGIFGPCAAGVKVEVSGL